MTGAGQHKPLVLGENPLTIEDVVSVAREYREVTLADFARRRINLSHAVVETLLEHDVKVYGITTGFASLRHKRISPDQAGKLSENLIKSHACGVGGPFAEDVVRAAMLLRAQTFALGYSGVTEKLTGTIIDALNNNLYPFVPQQGSVGSSGDLAPLSHLFLTLIGNPDGLIHKRNVDPGFEYSTALSRGEGGYITQARREDFVSLGSIQSPLPPLALQAKEGLAATNSAAFATALLVLSAYDTGRLIESSELITALSFEALQASPDPLDEKVTRSRPYAGHMASARAIRSALEDSDLCPGYVISGFNMAEYNQALIGLSELLSELQKGADADSAESLELVLQQMRERQGKIPEELREARKESNKNNKRDENMRSRDREVVICQRAFASISESWERLLGWSEDDNDDTNVSPQLQKRLSDIYHNHAQHVVRHDGDAEVQDNYSFRASPTVIGAARDTLAYVKNTVTTEINSATDNPLIFLKELIEASGADFDNPPDEKTFRAWLSDNWTVAADHVVSAANFHGEPIGLAADHLALALSEVGNISERRLAVLADHHHSKGLPAYLVWNPGLNSGLMLLQYVCASLASENKSLAVPATIDSIPTGESCEDHNSMATTAARKLARIVENVEHIVGIELLAAYQGAQFRKPMKLGRLTGKLEALVAEQISDTLARLSGWESIGDMRSKLTDIGLSQAAVDAIQPCVVDDVTLYPLVEFTTALVRTGALYSLVRNTE